MYSVSTTPGFIIDSRSFGEAGRLISIFTRDFGLLMATAQGIRLEKSKLRLFTQKYSFGVFSFVRGKEFWRLTGAQAFEGVTQSFVDRERNDDVQLLSARLALLLNRLLQGEGAHPELFDCLRACLIFISQQEKLSTEILQTLESLIVLRILHWLGYVGNDVNLNGHIQSIDVDLELLNSLSTKRTEINKHINKALRESQL